MGSGETETRPGGPSAEGRRGALLATATSVSFAQFGARVVVSPFVLAIAGVFAVTKGTVGAALTAMWAAFALGVGAGLVVGTEVGLPGRMSVRRTRR